MLGLVQAGVRKICPRIRLQKGNITKFPFSCEAEAVETVGKPVSTLPNFKSHLLGGFYFSYFLLKVESKSGFSVHLLITEIDLFPL